MKKTVVERAVLKPIITAIKTTATIPIRCDFIFHLSSIETQLFPKYCNLGSFTESKDETNNRNAKK